MIDRSDPRRCSPARANMLAVAAGLLFVAAPAAAHDFWLQPSRFWTAPSVRVPLTIQVGHGPARQRSPMPAARVTAFQSIGPEGRLDRSRELHLGQPRSDADLAFASPGTHVVLFSSNLAPSNLPAIRFNDYAKVEGLTAVIRHRVASGTTDAAGRELYARRAKALVQVGNPGTRAQPHVTRQVGLTLEIVPERNPYAPGGASALPVRIFYKGRPLAGALVKLTDLDADDKPVETHLTDRAGRAVFRLPRQGEWQMNVVWSEPLRTSRAADFLTIFSSLTFGFPRAGGAG